ncbi:hypothetical protein D3C84_761780 [compost metagenome]
MQVGHARQQRPVDAFGAVGAGVGLDLGQAAIGADLESDIIGPSTRQQSAFGKEGGHSIGTSRCVYLYIHIQTFACWVNSGKLLY